jgi:hypothetical protein
MNDMLPLGECHPSPRHDPHGRDPANRGHVAKHGMKQLPRGLSRPPILPRQAMYIPCMHTPMKHKNTQDSLATRQ